MMYNCVLQVQSILFVSAASTAFILCIAMFVTKGFSLDCLCNTYITISEMIRVISAAVNMSTSAIKLFRKDWNLESFSFGVSKLCSSLSNVFLLFLYLIAKSRNVLGALIKFGLIFEHFERYWQNLFLGCPI